MSKKPSKSKKLDRLPSHRTNANHLPVRQRHPSEFSGREWIDSSQNR
jgi:hypothetical protein